MNTPTRRTFLSLLASLIPSLEFWRKTEASTDRETMMETMISRSLLEHSVGVDRAISEHRIVSCSEVDERIAERYVALMTHKECCVAVFVASDEAPRWIPVTERLPEPKTDVLAIRAGGKIIVAMLFRTAHPDGRPAEPTWAMMLTAKSEAAWSADEPPITHWMPLPAPPMVVNDAGVFTRKEIA